MHDPAPMAEPDSHRPIAYVIERTALPRTSIKAFGHESRSLSRAKASDHHSNLVST